MLYQLEGVPCRKDWVDLKAIVRVGRIRQVGDKESNEVAYYINSRRGSAEELGVATRRHWSIENGLHWVLDVTFGEDASRVKDRRAAENLGMVRRVAASLLRQDTSKKGSIIGKQRRAGWDNDFCLHLLNMLSE